MRELELKFKPKRLDFPVEASLFTPREAANVARQLIADSPVEKAIALHLNTRRRLIGVHLVSTGLIDSTLVCPREVLTAALMSGARSIVLAHNHPSGDPTPSLEDLQVARQLAAAGELVGIDLDDALVIGEEGRYLSFREHGGVICAN